MKQWMYLIAWIVISEYVITGEQVCFVETTVQLVKLFVYSWTEKNFGILELFSRNISLTSQQILS